MKPFFLLLLLLPAALFCAMTTRTVEDGLGRLVFDFTITDTLVTGMDGKSAPAGALSDENREAFYAASFALPPKSSIKTISLSGAAAPARCVFAASGFVRQAFVAAFRIYPLSFQNGKPLFATAGRVTVTYSAPLSKTAQVRAPDNAFAEKAISGLIGNYGTSQGYRAPALVTAAKVATNPAQNAKIKLFIKSDGVYAISFEQIQSLGFSAGAIDPVYFHLYDAEREIPVYLQTAVKGSFSPGDRILFCGTFEPGVNGNYYPEHTLSKAYYLDWNSVPGLRAPLVSGAPRYLDAQGVVHSYDPAQYTTQQRNIIKVPSFRRSVHLEQDLMVVRLSTPGATTSTDERPGDFEFAMDDYWMWMELPGGVDQNLVSFSLDGAPSTAGKARIKIRLLGYTRGTHAISIMINSHKIKPASGPGVDTAAGTLTWSGQTSATFISEESKSVLEFLQGGNNQLSLFHSNGDAYFLNWIEVEYDATPRLVNGIAQNITLDTAQVRGPGSYLFNIPGNAALPEIWDKSGRRFFDFTFADNTVQLYDILQGPASYIVTQQVMTPDKMMVKPVTGIRSATHGADLLIITPEALRAQAENYAAFKRTRGLSVFVAAVESLYDEFGNGSVNPDAIKAFVKYAYESFSPKPFYLLLLGNGSEGSDKKSQWRNLIPTYFTQMNGWGITSADTRFTTVSGDDLFPDLSVGRIPGKNAAEVDVCLRKIMAYESASEQGAWKDNYLLIGGQEERFTEANDRFQKAFLKNSFTVKRVDADTASTEYFYGPNNPSVVRDAFNNGALFVNFYGHGGGSVWSDGRPSMMDNPGASALSNLPHLPVVFSMTCLTASFETVFDEFTNLWTPLGQTLFLSSRGGCAAFYGASGHSFVTPDYQLSLLTMEREALPSPGSVGDIVFGAEQAMMASFGTQYFPVICQYNLLGDPSMPVIKPSALTVTALNPMLSMGDSLRLRINAGSLTQGSGMVRLFQENGALSFYRSFTFTGPLYTLAVGFKPGQAISSGTARVMVWNNTQTAAGQAPFSINDIAIIASPVFRVSAAGDTQWIDKATVGDSLFLDARILLPLQCEIDTAYAAWGADTSFSYLDNNDTLTNLILMPRVNPADSANPRLYRTEDAIPLSQELFGQKRGLIYTIAAVYRTPDNVRRVYRKSFFLPVAAAPDLAFPDANKIALTVNGRLVARSRFLNYGESPAGSFSISQTVNDTQLFTLPYLSTLPMGRTDSVDAPVNASGFFKVQVKLDDGGAVTEGDETNNTASAFFGMTGTTLGRLDTVLKAPYGGVLIRAIRATDTFGVYTTMDNIDSLGTGRKPVFAKSNPYPLAPLQASYRPRGADSLGQYDFSILSEPAFASRDSLLRVSYRYTPGALFRALQNAAAAPEFGFYAWDTQLRFWKWQESSVDTTDSSVTLVTGAGKRLMPGRKLDVNGPAITASVNGRVLSYKDYIPLKTPIDIAIQDNSAVDTASVRVFLSGGEALARERYSMGYVGGTGDVNLSFRPFREGSDSLYVVARDVNGNASDTARFGYQLGSALTIKAFANHPNPFGTRTIFAFTITDDADVDMRIYTLYGKMIRRFSLKNIIGYHEVPWDAVDDNGRKISNGAYYLKLTVSNRDRTIEEIHKIAKAEGR